MRILARCVLLAVTMPGLAWAQAGAPSTWRAPDLTVQRSKPLPGAGYLRPYASPVEIPIDPTGWVRIQTPFSAVETPAGPMLVRVPHYQGPDGTYDTPADLTNAINGVPCGQDCTARALERWGYQP